MALIALTNFSLAACGDNAQETSPNDPSADDNSERNGPVKPVDARDDDVLPAPPDVRVLDGDEFVDLRAWSYCDATVCADGMPPANPQHIGNPSQILVAYERTGWNFKAYFQPANQPCARTFPAKLNEIGPGRFALRPAGYAGVYDVTLWGRGPGGDTSATFRWTTPSNGPLPSPSAYVAIISDHNGRPGSYGVEMAASQLAAEPQRVDATITITAANGNSLTISPKLDRGCPVDGSLWWEDTAAKGQEAADLGPAPFTYDVELVLDGQEYEAHATWPDDVIQGVEPNVRLDFSRGLPALS